MTRGKPLLLAMLAGLWAGALAPATSLAAAPTQRLQLDNGLVLLHRLNPGSLTLAVTCFVRASALAETAETAGWRNLCQQTLQDLPDAAGRPLQARLAEQGLQLRAQAAPDYVETVFLGTGDQLPQLMGCVREVLSATQPPPAQVALRRKQVLRLAANRLELPQTVGEDVALAQLFRQTPCAWPVTGTMALAALRPERLQVLRQMYYVPNLATVAVSGSVTWEAVREQAQRNLGDLLPRPREIAQPSRSLASPSALCLYRPWQGDNAAVTMAAACPGPEHPAFAAAAVLSAVLGSGEGSRLFVTLRDRLGLSYGIDTDLVPSRLCGRLQLSVACEPSQALQVFRVMRAEIARLVTEPPTEAEVRRAVAYLTGSLQLGHQRNADVAHYLGLFQVLAPEAGDLDLSASLQKITVPQVEAAGRWLTDSAVWVQVGGAVR